MPDATRYAAFCVAALALVVVPGPNLVYVVTRSIAQGRRAGLVSVLGIETGTQVHVAAAVVGVSGLVARSETAFLTLKYAGAAYLLWLGVRALRQPAGPVLGSGGDSGAEPAPLRRVYRDAVLVQVLNPKVVLFFLAFLPQFVTPGAGAGQARTQMLVLGLTLAVIGAVCSAAYALAADGLARRLNTRGARRQHYAVGGVYLGLGGLAALPLS